MNHEGYTAANEEGEKLGIDRSIARYTLWLAGFTGILSVSTIFLWWSTRQAAFAAKAAAEHIPRVERAYIRGGTGQQRPVDDGVQLFVTMNNYGKTPAFVGTITVSICPEAALPAIPKYETGIFRGYVLATNTDDKTAFPSDVSCIWDRRPDQIVFGRIWYRDIFNDCHSSGFILHLRPGLPGVARREPYWEDRDEPDLGPAA
jgi:hypothetical protein